MHGHIPPPVNSNARVSCRRGKLRWAPIIDQAATRIDFNQETQDVIKIKYRALKKAMLDVTMVAISTRWRLHDTVARLWEIAVVVCLLIGFICPTTAQVKPFAINSIAFPLIGSTYLDDQVDWTSIQDVIQELKALGANDAKITVSTGSYDMPTMNSATPSVKLNPTDDKMLSLMQQLKAAGLQVTVVPFVNINFDPNGNLLDSVHPQPTNFNAWISGHTAAMGHLARLAQQAGADRFSVFGDEVGPQTYEPANTQGWLDMISQVRSVFTGQLTSVLYADGTVFDG